MRPIYRFAPKPLRRAVIGLIPQARRMSLTRRLSRSRMHLSIAAPGNTRIVRDERALVRATVTSATPLALRRSNLDAAIDAMRRLGIPYFRVTSANPFGTAVGVPLSAQGKIRTELARLLEGDTRYSLRWRSVDDSTTRRRSGSGVILRVFQAVSAPDGRAVYGQRFGCDIEFWTQRGERLMAPRKNPVTPEVDASRPVTQAPEHVFGSFAGPFDDKAYQTRDEFTVTPPDRVTFPVDAVYTWVNGDDPAWRERKHAAMVEHTGVNTLNPMAASDSRYTNRDELRYSLRSLQENAPWIRHIYIVTDDQVPTWLNVSHPKVTVVDHKEIFGDTGKLPTFNSHAIESRLHRIDGLSEHFLYVNDDMFIGRPVTPDMFFSPNGLSYFFPSPAMVDLNPASVKDSPVDAAAKNNRTLIERHFGKTTVRKMKHIVYPLRRSVLAEIAQSCHAEVEATASHQFRHPSDLSITSSLYHYWAYCTGRAVPSKVSYMYADLADPSTPLRLSELISNRDMDSFCLNDTDADAVPLELQHRVISDFLATYFPNATSLELPKATPQLHRQRKESDSSPPQQPDPTRSASV
ncbi:stealth conserved region 3 domain-containing protein [Stackebrandtia soli]|uniref:stealth family protein n=1 Tax=Stackebrandtia soli TaxID=1892856 RepID=UPI0039EA7B13